MEEKEFNLSERMKKVDWELTKRLYLKDGREYGGAVWLYFHRDVAEFIKELKVEFNLTNAGNPITTKEKQEKIINKLAGNMFSKDKE